MDIALQHLSELQPGRGEAHLAVDAVQAEIPVTGVRLPVLGRRRQLVLVRFNKIQYIYLWLCLPIFLEFLV